MVKKVFVNGCFDLLHRGHLELFEYAKSLGDHLTVGIDSDSRVKELKGNHRPINTQDDRKFMLESLKWVDEVRVFDCDMELEVFNKKGVSSHHGGRRRVRG